MPIDYKKYPANWKTEIRPAILERDGNCCKFCGVENHSIGYRDENNCWHEIEKSFAGDMIAEDARDMGYKVIKIVLTIMHLDHDITNNDYSNLAAGCQKCHLSYDKTHHKKNANETRRRKKGLADLFAAATAS